MHKRFMSRILYVNGNLPRSALDVSDAQLLGASNHVNVILKISHRPSLADKVFVGFYFYNQHENEVTILASYDGTRGPQGLERSSLV